MKLAHEELECVVDMMEKIESMLLTIMVRYYEYEHGNTAPEVKFKEPAKVMLAVLECKSAFTQACAVAKQRNVKEYYDRLIEECKDGTVGEELEGSEACNWIKGLDV